MLNILQDGLSEMSIYQAAKKGFNAAMDVKQIRKANLRILIGEAGKAAKLAKCVDTDPSYISQIISKKGGREVGDEFARKLERATGKPHGWMDQDHSIETLSSEQQAILEMYNQMTDEDKKRFREVGDSFAAKGRLQKRQGLDQGCVNHN